MLPLLSVNRSFPGRGREVDQFNERPADVESDVADALPPLVRQHDGGGLALGPVHGRRQVPDGRGGGADGGAREVEALGASGRGGERRGGGRSGGGRKKSGSGSGSSSSCTGGRRPLLLLLLSVCPLVAFRSCILVVVV